MSADPEDVPGILKAILAEERRQTALLERERKHRSSADPRALLSKREAARLLGVSRGRTLDSLIASGQVRVVRIGGRLRVPRAELERLQAEGVEDTGPTTPRNRRRAHHSATELNEALKRRGF